MMSSQTKDYKIGKNAALRSKNKDWSDQNQNNVSGWNDISTHRLLHQSYGDKNILFIEFLNNKQET
jgi:hypothetical protein